MSNTTPPDEPLERGPHSHAHNHDPLYAELRASEDFQELRRRYRGFVFPVTVAFLVWYLLYVVLLQLGPRPWAPVIGNINWGLILGLLQFVTTFGIAWVYAKYAARNFDPLADRVRDRYDEERGRA